VPVTSVLFPDEGAELGYTILEDISERKGLENKLKRLYDAQETILHLATHDLKGPIGHIELLADLLQREVAGRAPARPRQKCYTT
jgi:two-component system sensor histidine kinase VicK